MQTWSPGGYAHNAHFVPTLGDAILQILAPEPGERILDLGCGDGVLMQRLVEAGAVVFGVDSSPDMIAAARARGLDASVCDATQLTFTSEFDAVFSNAALHWVKPPEAAIAGVYRALKPGGRFVGEFGALGNVAAISVALLAVLTRRGVQHAEQYIPWFYPSPAEYQALLEKAGFTVETCHLFPRPTPLPTGMRGWLETFAKAHLAALPASEHNTYLDEVTTLLRPVLCDAHGNWTADYVRIRFVARSSNTSPRSL